MSKYYFTDKYLTYVEMTSDIDLLCKQIPKNIEFEKIEIAKTLEGRALLAIRIYPKGKKIEQPTIWMDANMHSNELIGTNAVLAHLENLTQKLIFNETKYFNINYIFVPRICPNGAEQYFTEGKRSRSNARDARSQIEKGSYWNRQCLVEKDLNENGYDLFKNKNRIGFMRKETESGIWIADELYPQLIRRRELGDVGPFYDIYPEGTIENFDGLNIPCAANVGDNEIDLNRNFPVEWAPNYLDNKSGKIPLSEIESRAIAEFSAKIPQIYFWLNYHSFGGVFIRPLQTKDDCEMSIVDKSIYLTLDKKIEEITGYPSVSGHSEFTYIPGKPLQGCLTSYSYQSLGAISYVCELWDLPAKIGRKERPFIKRYDCWSKTEWRKIYEYDRDENQGIMFGHSWKKYNHKQLGEVEISEFPTIFGINNPPQKWIHEVIQNQVPLLSLFVDVAPLPKVTVRLAKNGTKEVKYAELTISNVGFLPTFVSEARNRSQGVKKIIIEVMNVKNGTLIGEPIYHMDPLSGFSPIINGWIDSVDLGTNFCCSKTIKIPFSTCSEIEKLSAIFKVSFSHLGEYYAKLGES